MKSPRDLALILLNRLSDRPRPLRSHFQELLGQNPQLDERDVAFLVQLVQGVLRWRVRLDWVIQQSADFPKRRISPRVLNILRLALYQVLFLDRVPESAAVNEAVKQAKSRGGAPYLVSFVNGILRNICRNKDSISFPDPSGDRTGYLSVTYSYPRWLVKKWLGEWGDSFAEALLDAQNRVPALCVRANQLRVGREEFLECLKEEGVVGEPGKYAPEAVTLKEFRGRVDKLACFGNGLFQVQDQAAQITSHLLGPNPGETLLDLCAGFGGKTTHLAEIMGDRGRVLALDISRARLISLESNRRRLGIKSIFSVQADARIPRYSFSGSSFDRIMVDAPCSGLGVLARHPDGKWNREEKDIGRLADLQEEIVRGAAPLLKPGGRMLYVTCTISREENDGIVERCLRRQKGLRLLDLRDHGPQWAQDLVDEQGFFRTFPNVHGTDGFFAALFEKGN
ncbi:MAG: 16S rRNA (cytosine(967)-C(5))-methyltransferase RsmB [Deltaproteobacteria bacterium]|nr:16S rRNA (cytosine(967)-C(5))-methyltransferase RsmB [Deltaproteobacteria bacterium]